MILSSSARRTAARRLLTPSLLKMLLVCVRIVLNDTVSSRAMSGPSRSDASNRRTSSSRSLSGSTSIDGRSDRVSLLRSAKPRQQCANIADGDPAFDRCMQQLRHPGTFIDKYPDVALRFRQRQGAFQ